jgi:hypothetical protein
MAATKEQVEAGFVGEVLCVHVSLLREGVLSCTSMLDCDRDSVDIRRGDHLAVIVEGQSRTVCLPRRLGADSLGGAHRSQLHVGLACTAGRCERADQVPLMLAPTRPSRIVSTIK